MVDVPGHERFVRTMVAGATGIDLFLMCVAADDGVMPQTREHVAVLEQLGVRRGVVAVTKADRADPARVAAGSAELMPGAEVVAVSATEGTGTDDLLAALERAAARATARSETDGPALLHLDRAFTLRGIGTVVTGTLWQGTLRGGQRVRIEPGGRRARVRSVQVHDEPVEAAAAGQRVALALAGVDWRDVGRGDVVCGADSEIAPTYRVDVLLDRPPAQVGLRHGERVHVHHGTREAPARLVPLWQQADDDALAQLRLDAPIVPRRGDAVVLRRPARFETVGGARVLDPRPARHGADAEVRARLGRIAAGGDAEGDGWAAEDGLPRSEAAHRPSDQEPPPLDAAALKLAALLRADGERPRADGDLAEAVGLSPGEAVKRLNRLERAGLATRVSGNLHYDPPALDALTARIAAICARDGSATIAGVRDELGTTRRYAQALLEHLDATKVTLRRGDAHVLRRLR